MIHSMTAFGSARSESDAGVLTVEIRSVNNRFLDINLRLPDDLRLLESSLREQLDKCLLRGKVDVRLSYRLTQQDSSLTLDPDRLIHLAQQLQLARQHMPDIEAPRLLDLLTDGTGSEDAFDPEIWGPLSRQALGEALDQLQEARQREGQRLATFMLETAAQMLTIVEETGQRLPAILQAHQARIAQRLHDSLLQVSPDGFAQISGAELSARIAQEASLFSLRSDVAEELSRLRSHLQELSYLLGADDAARDKRPATGGKASASVGKRLDFLCQEMNREANTLGSKAADIDITRAAIDLKLLIEQIREQAQNIE